MFTAYNGGLRKGLILLYLIYCSADTCIRMPKSCRVCEGCLLGVHEVWHAYDSVEDGHPPVDVSYALRPVERGNVHICMPRTAPHEST